MGKIPPSSHEAIRQVKTSVVSRQKIPGGGGPSMSVFLSSFGLILFLGATGQFGFSEDDEMDLFERSGFSEVIEDNMEMTKRTDVNIAKFRDFSRFLKKARQQQILLSQQEEQKAKGDSWEHRWRL